MNAGADWSRREQVPATLRCRICESGASVACSRTVDMEFCLMFACAWCDAPPGGPCRPGCDPAGRTVESLPW